MPGFISFSIQPLLFCSRTSARPFPFSLSLQHSSRTSARLQPFSLSLRELSRLLVTDRIDVASHWYNLDRINGLAG
ncbi:hypothetical protein IHE45_05G204000 [Dioscorea alata]|uniref:Uncharacterized protein n=1 Tax=Dioscorea alata TaxID=55571 RepID=A0ACB7W8L0_DIOAL|nr:hypothetical protein IHE45_05G204000 [Dioscorea alata]